MSQLAGLSTQILTWLVPLTAAAGVVGWILGRRRPFAPALRPGVSPHLLPDPALEWLRRAHDAAGIWILEQHQSEGGLSWRTQRIIDDNRLSSVEAHTVERRLEQVGQPGQAGVERLEKGNLAFAAGPNVVVGILVASQREAGQQLELMRADLQRLLDGVARRPVIRELATEQEIPLESIGSVGLRLAYQLERILGADVVVAANEISGVKVIGVSGRADRRLLNTYAPAKSGVARVALGEMKSLATAEDPMGDVIADRRQRLATAHIVPIEDGGQPVGAVIYWLATNQTPTGGALAEMAEAIRSAASRITRALKVQELDEAATTDPLTGLRNRRGLEAAMTRVGAQQGSLVVLDLDRFKLLNDTLGHPAGDAALVHLGRVLLEQIRGGDIAARIGGEEFAVWLPGATLSWGGRIADRIRIKLGTTPWDWQGRPWPLSASFGVAACPETSRSQQNLAAQADAALYLAKKTGRNRVELAPKQQG